MHLAATDYLQVVMVQALVLKLRDAFPGVRLALHHLDPARLQAQMANGDIDLALMTPAEEQGNLRSRHLFDEQYMLIGRRGHPAMRPGLSLEQFCALDHVIVSLDGGAFITAVDAGLAALGHTRRVVLSASSFLFVPAIVARSDMVALVPARLSSDPTVSLDSRSDMVALVPARLSSDPTVSLDSVDCPFPVPGFAVSMLWHERNHSHSGQRWLRALIAEFAAQL